MAFFKTTKQKFDDYADIVDEIRNGNEISIHKLPRSLQGQISQDVWLDFIAHGGSIAAVDNDVRDNIPQEVWNERARSGGDLSYWGDYCDDLTKNLPQEVVNEMAVKGYVLSFIDLEKIVDIPQEAINERAKNGGDLSLFYDKIDAIPEEYILEGISKTGSLLGLRSKKLAEMNLPQEVYDTCAQKNIRDMINFPKQNITQDMVNAFVAQYGVYDYSFDLKGALPANLYKGISQEAFNTFAKTGRRIEYFDDKYIKNMDKETFDAIPDLRMEDCFKKGANIEWFTKNQIEDFSYSWQERFEQGHDMGNLINARRYHNIDKRAENGGSLKGLPSEQIAKIPQSSVDIYVAKGGDVTVLSNVQRENISLNAINDRIIDGGNLEGFDSSRIKELPQALINEAVANGSEIGSLSHEQRDLLPQDVVEDYVRRGGTFSFMFNQQQTDALPPDAFDDYEKNSSLKIRSLSTSLQALFKGENKDAKSVSDQEQERTL